MGGENENETLRIILLVLGMIVDTLLMTTAIYLIYKHIVTKKYEFFFVFIVLTMPIAFLLNNLFEIYALVITSDDCLNTIFIYNYHKFPLENIELALLAWGPLVILLILAVAYLSRWLSYYIIVLKYMKGDYYQAWPKKVGILTFTLTTITGLVIYGWKLFSKTREVSTIFEVLLSSGFIVVSVILTVVIYKFLQGLK